MQTEFIFTPSKEQKENLKSDLKEKSKEITQQKNLFKSKQREKSKFELSATHWHWRGANYDQWAALDTTQFREMQKLHIQQEDYRVRHIVYSMMRGKTIQQIEPKIKKEREYETYLVRSQAKKMLYSLGLSWREDEN